MARLTQDTKDKILADYHTNKFSQRELSKKYNVSIGTVNKLTKEVSPQNEHLVNAQIALLEGQSQLPNEQMNAIMNTANDEVRRRGLVFGGVEKAVQKMNKIIEDGYIEDKLNIGDGMQKFEQRKLNTTDVKNAIDGYDKASITLGVNQRHANTIIANSNNQQTNNEIVVEIV